jgi:hypothetical protein
MNSISNILLHIVQKEKITPKIAGVNRPLLVYFDFLLTTPQTPPWKMLPHPLSKLDGMLPFLQHL